MDPETENSQPLIHYLTTQLEGHIPAEALAMQGVQLSLLNQYKAIRACAKSDHDAIAALQFQIGMGQITILCEFERHARSINPRNGAKEAIRLMLTNHNNTILNAVHGHRPSVAQIASSFKNTPYQESFAHMTDYSQTYMQTMSSLVETRKVAAEVKTMSTVEFQAMLAKLMRLFEELKRILLQLESTSNLAVNFIKKRITMIKDKLSSRELSFSQRVVVQTAASAVAA